MKYMGSKNRIAKYILPIILKNRKENQWYIEPFVGGANCIDKVKGKRIGFDNNIHLINALTLIKKPESLPMNNKQFTEQDYINIKADKNNKLYGYAGFAFSYSGKWYGGWCRDSAGKRDYVAEAYRNAIKQSPKIKNIIFKCCSYENINIPPNIKCIIYCDPPYQNTTKYKTKFNHEKFWEWCRKMTLNGHHIFISEYAAPNDFVSVWEKKIVSSLTKNTGSKRGVENLFVPWSQNDHSKRISD